MNEHTSSNLAFGFLRLSYSAILPRASYYSQGRDEHLEDSSDDNQRFFPAPVSSTLTAIHGAVVTDADETDVFAAAYEKIAAKSGASLAALERKFAAPVRRVLYQDLESTIWILWQVRPCDVTVNHIGHALYLLTRKSKGGVELDRASCEARGIDYATLMSQIRPSLAHANDLSTGPTLPRISAARIAPEPARDTSNIDTESDFMPDTSREGRGADPSGIEADCGLKVELSAPDTSRGTEDAPISALELAVATTDQGSERLMVDDFLLQCNRESDAGLKVIRKHIWLAAGHTNPRQFQYWQERSDKATAEDDRNFHRLLRMAPAEFIALLKKRHLLAEF